jgi:hypothetical protein
MPTPSGFTSWDDLEYVQVEAAKTMGFDQETWDNVEFSQYSDFAWEDLPREVQLAIMVLGDDIQDNDEWHAAIAAEKEGAEDEDEDEDEDEQKQKSKTRGIKKKSTGGCC